MAEFGDKFFWSLRDIDGSLRRLLKDLWNLLDSWEEKISFSAVSVEWVKGAFDLMQCPVPKPQQVS